MTSPTPASVAAELNLTRVRLRLETLSPFRIRDYAGSLFRGGFGKFFRDLACSTGAPTCAGCPVRASCSYAQIFESPVDPERAAVLRKYPFAPHPFTLGPPLDGPGVLPPGSPLDLDISLFGPGREHLVHFLVAFERLGRTGNFGGSFGIVNGRDSGAEAFFDGRARRFLRSPLPWTPPAPPGPVRRLRLRFLSPLRLRVDGRYCSRPSFPSLVQALVRRLNLLLALYGRGQPDPAWARPVLAQADAARLIGADFRPFLWSRFSGRQHERILMDGITGAIEVQGDLTELAGWLLLGEALYLGSGTSLGLGRYRVSLEGA